MWRLLQFCELCFLIFVIGVFLIHSTNLIPQRAPNRWLAAACALSALILIVLLVYRFLLIQEPQPARLGDERAGGSILIESDNIRVLFDDGCFDVRWRLQGIQAVKLNDAATVGEGYQTICGLDAVFSIEFADGTHSDYVFTRDVLVGGGLDWQLSLAALLLAVAALRYAGMFRLGTVGRWQASLCLPDKTALGRSSAVFWVVVLFVLLGAALRTSYLDIPIRGDEAWSFLDYASRPLSQALSVYDSTNNHLLHTLLQHVAFQVFGNQITWLRLPVFFAGVLSIAAAYTAGASLFNRRVGLYTAAFVACVSRMIEFSVNARAYSIWVLLLLLMLVSGHRALRNNRKRDWALLAVFVALGFYATPLTLYSTGMVALWLLFNLLAQYRGHERRRRLVSAIVAGIGAALLTGLLYLPPILWLAAGSAESTVVATVAPRASLSEYASMFPERVGTTWGNITEDIALVLRALLATGFLLACLIYRHIAREPVSLPLVALLWLLPLHYATRSIVVWRAYLFLIPILAMVAFAGWDALLSSRRWSVYRQRWLTVVGLVALAATLVAGLGNAQWPSDSYDSVPGGEEAANYLENHLGEYDTVVARDPVDNVLRYYLARRNTEAALTAIPRLHRLMDSETPETILLVVNFRHGNVGSLKDGLSLDLDRYSEPQFIESLSGGELWSMTRLD